VEELAGCSWGDLPFDVSPIEVKFTEDAVNELGLHQVDIALTIPLDFDPKEVSNGPLLESDSLHVFSHFQQLGMLRASEDGIISVENVDAILFDKVAWAGGQLDEANALELLDQVQKPACFWP